jgi:hypothetical protein
MRPVSSSIAENGAGRTLADDRCIPNLLELGDVSPAFSIAFLCVSVSLCASQRLGKNNCDEEPRIMIK